MARAFEFAASEYHWTAQAVRGLSDELFVLYLDLATDRLIERARSDFEGGVERVRLGTIIAYDAQALAQWQRLVRSGRPEPVGLSGEQLERTLMMLAVTNPDIVEVRAG